MQSTVEHVSQIYKKWVIESYSFIEYNAEISYF